MHRKATPKPKTSGTRKQPALSNALTKDWDELEKDVMILSGSCSQGHKKFKAYNEQSAAVCIVACAMTSIHPLHVWSKNILDHILEIGTNLHLKTRALSDNRCLSNITPPQVDKYFFLKDIKVSMRVSVDIVSEKLPRSATLTQNLEDLLRRFFERYIKGVFHCERKNFALWKTDRFYFIFDPFEHNPRGGKWMGLPGQGFCYAMRLKSVRRLADTITKNINVKSVNLFVIYPCDVEKLIKINTKPPESIEAGISTYPEKPKVLKKSLLVTPSVPPPKRIEEPATGEATTTTPEITEEGEKGAEKGAEIAPRPSRIPPERPKLKSITNFVELLQGRVGILRASTHQKDPKFTRYLGKQSLANAVAVLTMLRQHKSKTWVRYILDEVLKLGEVIHHDSKKLRPGEICNKITLNEIEYSPKIERYGTIGKMQSEDDKILSLDQALSNFLIDHDCCILVGPHVVAIWKEEDRFYMFDPEERDPQGRIALPGLPGVACLTWFTNLNDLIALYMENLPKERRRDRFMVSEVTIKDYMPLAENWHNYKALTFNKWILRGTFSQQDRRFPPETRNSQCTAIATMALAYKELKPEQEWDASTVDACVTDGDEFYRSCVEYLKDSNRFKHKYLMVDELKRTFDVSNKRVNLEIDDCLVNGIVNAKSDTGILNLKRGFEEFFTESDAGVITANLQTMAVWKRDQVYYYWDSHSRNEKGIVSGHGTACVLRAMDLEDLTKILTTNIGADKQNLYNISRIIVNLNDLTEDGTVKPPLNYYEAVNDLIAILRSNFSEKHKKFDLNVGKQSVPMCMAALAMNTLATSFTWNKEDLDQVLVLGDKLYAESMAANYAEDVPAELNVDEVSTANVKKQLKIGSNEFNMEFETLLQGNFEDNLEEAINNSYQFSQNENRPEPFQMILESQLMIASIWRDDNLIYLFDPKPRDQTGQVFGKDDWSVKIEEEEEGEDEDEESEEEDIGLDELAGGDNFGPINEPLPEDLIEEENQEPPPIKEKKGSEYWRAQEEEGRACVLRFSRVEDLVKHLVDNTPPNQRKYMEFILKRVDVSNTPVLHEIFDPETEEKQDEFAGDWHDFKEVDYGKWILRAGKHLDNVMFPECNRGKQQLPMCIVSLAFVYLYAVVKFKPPTLDTILAYGDRFYTVLRRLREKELRSSKELKLTDTEIETILNNANYHINDYPRNICMGCKLAKWDFKVEETIGDITSTIEEIPNLPRGLDLFFKVNTYGILTCKDYVVSIWHDDELYYMFDPHPTGPNGVKSPVGVACITRFKKVEDLAEIYLLNLPKLGNHFFEIHSFTFEKEECERPRKPEVKEEKLPKLGGFSQVMAGKEILRGTLKLDCTKYSGGVHLHSSAIAFIALAVSLVMESETWTKILINQVLLMGEDLYNDTLERLSTRFNPWDEKLDIYRLNTDFQVGKLRANCALRFMEQRGIVDVKGAKNLKTLNLRQGLERFFEENSHGVLIAGKLTLAVWEEMKGTEISIYIFDPNSRGGTGLPAQGGVACVMKFCNALVAANHIKACLMGVDKTKTEFAIVPVEIVIGTARSRTKGCRAIAKQQPTAPQPVTCPGRVAALQEKRVLRQIAQAERDAQEERRLALLGRSEMYQVTPGVMIVRGLRCVSKDRELPVTIVAFVFMRIAADLSKWTYKQIELVLETGNQLYIDSFNAYLPDVTKLRLEHVLRRVLLKDCEVKVDIRNPVVFGSFRRNNVITALNKFFLKLASCLFSYATELVTILFKGGYYYVFDPYSRDLNGNKTENGCACMLRFENIETLVDKLIENLSYPEDERPRKFALIVIAVQSVVALTKK